MAFKEVEKEPETERVSPFWKPKQVGDAIEGNIYDFDESVYKGKKQIRINLYCGEDEDGEPMMSLLPNHADLKRTYVNLNVGDYIRVEAVDKIQTENMDWPKWIYKVLVDKDRFVTWDDSVDDDYYAE